MTKKNHPKTPELLSALCRVPTSLVFPNGEAKSLIRTFTEQVLVEVMHLFNLQYFFRGDRLRVGTHYIRSPVQSSN